MSTVPLVIVAATSAQGVKGLGPSIWLLLMLIGLPIFAAILNNDSLSFNTREKRSLIFLVCWAIFASVLTAVLT